MALSLPHGHRIQFLVSLTIYSLPRQDQRFYRLGLQYILRILCAGCWLSASDYVRQEARARWATTSYN